MVEASWDDTAANHFSMACAAAAAAKGDGYRAVEAASFCANVQSMLLRGIAWAGKRPVDSLMTVRPQRGGGRGRGTNPPAGAEGRGSRGGQSMDQLLRPITLF